MKEILWMEKNAILYGGELEERHHHRGIKIQIIFRNGNGVLLLSAGDL